MDAITRRAWASPVVAALAACQFGYFARGWGDSHHPWSWADDSAKLVALSGLFAATQLVLVYSVVRELRQRARPSGQRGANASNAAAG